MSQASTGYTYPIIERYEIYNYAIIKDLVYFAHLHTSSQHDYGLNPVLPYRPPEMDDCLFHWAYNNS